MAHRWFGFLGLGRFFGNDPQPLDQTVISPYVFQNAAIRRADPDFPEVGFAPGGTPANLPAPFAVTVEGAVDPLRHDVVRNASQHRHHQG